jgi:integrating conjugative element protein (TIGR03746 family)
MKHKLMEGWQSNAWKKEDQDRAVISTQNRFIWIMVGVCIFFAVGWMRSPSDITVHIPPDITNGATFKVNAIPNSFLHSFAYEIWQGVNYWPEDGAQDYSKNLHTYAAYLTPKFQNVLLEEYADLKKAGQVQRQRSLQGIAASTFESSTVKKLSENSWEVDLKVRLVEYRNNQIVKDIEMQYPLKVIRWDVSSEKNPYGLAIDGFISPPVRLKTYTSP